MSRTILSIAGDDRGRATLHMLAPPLSLLLVPRLGCFEPTFVGSQPRVELWTSFTILVLGRAAQFFLLAACRPGLGVNFLDLSHLACPGKVLVRRNSLSLLASSLELVLQPPHLACLCLDNLLGSPRVDSRQGLLGLVEFRTGDLVGGAAEPLFVLAEPPRQVFIVLVEAIAIVRGLLRIREIGLTSSKGGQGACQRWVGRNGWVRRPWARETIDTHQQLRLALF